MFRHVFSVSALALIIGLNGTNPFFDTEASIPGVIGDVELPPEAELPPTATTGSILRYEERNDVGAGSPIAPTPSSSMDSALRSR